METGTHHPERFGGTARGTTEEAKEKARELSRTARDRALSTVDAQKAQLSGLLDRVAETLKDDRLGAYASEYVRRGADLLRGRSADEILHSTRQAIRSRPGVVLSACFVAGLALARIVKGSTDSTDSGHYGEARGGDGWGGEP